MWETIERGAAAASHRGVTLQVVMFGKHGTPVTRLKIGEDVLEKTDFTADDDVEVQLGRDEHAGKLRISLNQAGRFTLKAPRGTVHYLLLSGQMPFLQAAMPATGCAYTVDDDGAALIVTLPDAPQAAAVPVRKAA